MLLMHGVDVATLNLGVLSPSVNVVANVATLQVEIISILTFFDVATLLLRCHDIECLMFA